MAAQAFDTRAGFQARLAELLGRACVSLQMFDPDFADWQLGSSASEALLRTFLRGGGRLQLVAHSNARLERDAPRFLRLLQDYSHLIDCRLTNRSLRHLTDSFCVADGRDIVRRFHSDFFRGEANFDAPSSTQTSLERFEGIWAETMPGLHAIVTGL